VLTTNNLCRKLFLPQAGSVEIAFGLNRSALRRRHVARYAARFELRLTEIDSGEAHELLDETLALGSDFRQRRTVSLEPFALRHVELCVATEALGPAATRALDGPAVGTADRLPEQATEPFAYWSNPIVTTADTPIAVSTGAETSIEGLTDEEIEVRMEHLRALGYVD